MKNFKIDKSNFIVLLFIGSLVFCKGIGLSSDSLIYTLIFILGSFFAIIKILNEKYSKKEVFLCFLLVTIGLLDFIIGKDSTLLFTAVILSCLKNVNLKKIIKIMFILRLITFLGIILLTEFGFLQNNYIEFFRDGEGIIKRYSFIFGHPNLAHSSFDIIIFLGLYLFYNKINIFNALIIITANYVLYKYTYSRTGFILCIFIIFFTLIYKKSNFLKKSLFKILPYSLFIFTLISIIIGLLYDKIGFVKILDSLLTGRISYINILLRNYNVPIIGSSIYNNYVNFDNGYITLLYEGGLLAFLWFNYVSFETNKIIVQKNMYREGLLIFAFLLYSFTESYYSNILMNASLIFFSIYMFKTNSKEDINNESNNINSNI